MSSKRVYVKLRSVYMTLPLNKLTHLQLVSLVQKWRYLPVFGQIGMVGVTCPGACAGSNHFGGASSQLAAPDQTGSSGWTTTSGSLDGPLTQLYFGSAD